MELKFRNITRCSKKMYNQFIEFHSTKHKKREILNMIFMILVVIYMLVFNIIYHNYIMGFTVVIIAIIYFISKEYYKTKVVERELKSSKIKNNEEIEFCFYDKYFIVVTNEETQKVKYYKLHETQNDEDNFYLYLDKTHALIINKKGFIKGTVKEFQKFILKKCRFSWFFNLRNIF